MATKTPPISVTSKQGGLYQRRLRHRVGYFETFLSIDPASYKNGHKPRRTFTISHNGLRQVLHNLGETANSVGKSLWSSESISAVSLRPWLPA